MKKLFVLILLLFAAADVFARCHFDSECPAGYHCNSSTNKCTMGKWPDGGCNFDSDCLEGYHCGNGECRMGRWPDGGCSFDSDCLNGYHCNDGECRMGKWPDGGCNFDSDCLDGFECEDNECEPASAVMKDTILSPAFVKALKGKARN
jgi:hypothetical protein